MLPVISKVAAIKLPSLAFDVLLAVAVYKLVGLARPGKRAPAVAALVAVLLPTVVVNSAMWGQADAMYVAL